MKRFFLLSFFFFSLSFAYQEIYGKGQRSSEELCHLFIGAEHGITVLGTFRGGHKNFEFGLLNANLNDTTLGIAYIFNIANSFYTELGAGAVSEKPGLFTALGFEYTLFKILDLRLEFNASSSYDNFSSGGFILGANISL